MICFWSVWFFLIENICTRTWSESAAFGKLNYRPCWKSTKLAIESEYCIRWAQRHRHALKNHWKNSAERKQRWDRIHTTVARKWLMRFFVLHVLSLIFVSYHWPPRMLVQKRTPHNDHHCPFHHTTATIKMVVWCLIIHDQTIEKIARHRNRRFSSSSSSPKVWMKVC